ncbi:MAG: trypsin-like peptidase domain-containing protein [Holophagales bacterium]|nr:trypsin-like peptidase domain-containing protein [Holophagales bacterium]MYG30064.1 trypsin-like peptidase domain-containing protein [Holophagales bacterium]MYI78743.1 trypsin-like peptidase domain-containing protein [Holophagales bacterium]
MGCMLICLRLLVLALLSGCATAVAQQSDVACPSNRQLTVNVLYRVFPIRIGTDVGSAFTLEIGDEQYIVTAGHLLKGPAPTEVEVKIAREEWVRIPVRLVGRGEGQDVLVLATTVDLSPRYPVEVGTEGLVLGQPVRFLGFLPDVETAPIPGYERGAPLVAGGVFSGFGKNSGSLWIDGHNNKGFSGGPVVYHPLKAPTLEECRWKVAGIITGYHHVPVFTEGNVQVLAANNQPVVANSGLMVATTIRTVEELVRRTQGAGLIGDQAAGRERSGQ